MILISKTRKIVGLMLLLLVITLVSPYPQPVQAQTTCAITVGTINDLAMAGAKPVYLSAAFVLEEGLPITELQRIVNSMAEAARTSGVEIVTGDTKVVERGQGDGVYINTSGVGVIEHERSLSSDQARPGDKVILSGPLGDHGMAVMAQREGLEFESTIESDTAALFGLVQTMLDVSSELRCLRDPIHR